MRDRNFTGGNRGNGVERVGDLFFYLYLMAPVK